MKDIIKALSKSLAVEILYYLKEHREQRYFEIQKLGHYATVSRRLKELKKLGIVKRTVKPEYPVKVSYTLTRKGEKVVKLLDELKKFK